MNKIIHGDCLEKMKEMPDNSIDTLITDPPYGLSFMGKKWDYDVPKIEIWKECLRVLKPGGTALIFAGSRTQHRMAVNVEDAGFILKDCIMWLYGSGFPKATDISKQLDKIKGLKRTGTIKTDGSGSGEIRTTSDRERQLDTVYETGDPISEEAKLWEGWKSHGLKPAYEPILVAMKPNDGTYANNALKHGVAGLNIDEGRIGTEEHLGRPQAKNSAKNMFTKGLGSNGYNDNSKTGRFPANILLDEEAARLLDLQSGVTQTNPMGHNNNAQSTGSFGVGTVTQKAQRADKGGASRFFMNCTSNPKAC